MTRRVVVDEHEDITVGKSFAQFLGLEMVRKDGTDEGESVCGRKM